MKNKNINILLSILKVKYPDAKTKLIYQNSFQLLVATILSAQCTDKTVNQVTLELFKKYSSIESFAKARIEELENNIRKTGFFRNKAKAIKNSAKMILEKYQGLVPKTMEELITLPGVARKTANVILYNAFGIQSGVVVDTHVKRISYRLGLTKNTNPVKIEQDLMKIIPQQSWGQFAHALVLHGRALCQARKPKCAECFLAEICEYKSKV